MADESEEMRNIHALGKRLVEAGKRESDAINRAVASGEISNEKREQLRAQRRARVHQIFIPLLKQSPSVIRVDESTLGLLVIYLRHQWPDEFKNKLEITKPPGLNLEYIVVS